MGKINVEGLGIIEIQGDKPTAQESQKIQEAIKTLAGDTATDSLSNQQADDAIKGPSFGRIATEVAGSIIGSLGAGGASLPGIAIRIGMLSKPFFKALAKATAGSAAGGAGGALVSETFDPSEDVMKEVARAAGEGALGEAVGAPIVIQGGKIVKKMLGSPMKYAETLEGAKSAEKILQNKSYEILYGPEKAAELMKLPFKERVMATSVLKTDQQAVTNYMKKKGMQDASRTKLVEAATEMEKGLTPAFKTNNQLINILENMGSKSLLGGGGFAKRYRAQGFIGDQIAEDVVQQFVTRGKVGDQQMLGQLFFKTFTDGEAHFRAVSDGLYKKVDDLLAQGKTKKVLSTTDKVMGDASLRETISEISENIYLRSGNQLGTTVDDLSVTIGRVMDEATENISYKDLTGIRSDVAARATMFKLAGDQKAFQASKKLVKKMDDMLSPEFLAKSGLDPAAADALGQANKFYEEGMDVFSRGTIKAILAQGARNTSDLGTVMKRITDGNKLDLVDRVMKEIDSLPKVTAGIAAKGGPKGLAITTAQANGLKDAMRGSFLANRLAKAEIADPQFGNYMDAQKFINQIQKAKTDGLLGKLFSTGDIKRIEDLQLALGFAQGKIDDIGGIPGGILIQMKQAGAAGTVMQLGPQLMFGGAVGGAALTGNFVPAVGILLAPKFIGKAMLDPRFQQIVFKSQFEAAQKGTLDAGKAHMFMRQAIGRLLTLGAIDQEQADLANAQIDERNKILASKASRIEAPLPNVARSDFPVIEGGMPQSPGGMQNPNRIALAGGDPVMQGIATRGYNQGGIISAKKVNS
jgi:hypothetical protein